MSEWRPIETAPQDGTEFLAYARRNGVDHFNIAWFAWSEEDDGSVWFNGDVVVNPTHWMPLPNAPTP